MAVSLEWSETLKKEGLSEALCTRVGSTYQSPDEFRSCFANLEHLEQYIKGFLTCGVYLGCRMQAGHAYDRSAEISSLAGADREEIVKRFSKNYPGFLLHAIVPRCCPFAT